MDQKLASKSFQTMPPTDVQCTIYHALFLQLILLLLLLLLLLLPANEIYADMKCEGKSN
jgi:hypothetical protein